MRPGHEDEGIRLSVTSRIFHFFFGFGALRDTPVQDLWKQKPGFCEYTRMIQAFLHREKLLLQGVQSKGVLVLCFGFVLGTFEIGCSDPR